LDEEVVSADEEVVESLGLTVDLPNPLADLCLFFLLRGAFDEKSGPAKNL